MASHDAWTADKEKLLTTDDYTGTNLGAVLALKKRHEAFRVRAGVEEERAWVT